jgi:hypothetical protein
MTTDAKDRKMQLDAARALLKEAGISDAQVLTKEQLDDRIGKERREIEPLKAQNEEMAERLRTVEKQLKVYTDKDATAEEKIAAEIDKHRKEAEGYKQRYEDQQRQTERQLNARKAEYVKTTLHQMLPDDASVPKRVLVRELTEQLPGFAAEETKDGQFKLTYTNPDSIPGEPRETVADWFKNQTWAHKPTGERIPTNGAPPPGQPTEKKLSEMSGTEAAEHVANKQFGS